MTIKVLVTAAIAAASILSGCATIIEGRTQEVFVNVTPVTAECVAFRRGEEVGRYSYLTRSMHVPKSRRDLTIRCSAPGYVTADMTASSSLSAWGVASFLFIDLGITDFATGALKKYPASITIAMLPDPSLGERPAPAAAIANELPRIAPRASYNSGFPPVTSSGTR